MAKQNDNPDVTASDAEKAAGQAELENALGKVPASEGGTAGQAGNQTLASAGANPAEGNISVQAAPLNMAGFQAMFHQPIVIPADIKTTVAKNGTVTAHIGSEE